MASARLVLGVTSPTGALGLGDIVDLGEPAHDDHGVVAICSSALAAEPASGEAPDPSSAGRKHAAGNLTGSCTDDALGFGAPAPAPRPGGGCGAPVAPSESGCAASEAPLFELADVLPDREAARRPCVPAACGGACKLPARLLRAGAAAARSVSLASWSRHPRAVADHLVLGTVVRPDRAACAENRGAWDASVFRSLMFSLPSHSSFSSNSCNAWRDASFSWHKPRASSMLSECALCIRLRFSVSIWHNFCNSASSRSESPV
mmetsp:Transcript_39469/g.126522  ORF Transcript_39469/g.126522 Transcript_39469/m.126522 type:complete len:262 (-) Transcript_39469:1078-1863(-)